ncbi:FAD-dependent oxidoreductase [Massilia glaciei]|uniref:FAD-dependent oxidoreductase n=2 Tax=Massilia glaciei TaxID=1524097 RepID=A0A2U2HFC1_9BURK|nr:FAD-dependent oxidoreductase [Massilia glaciei]
MAAYGVAREFRKRDARTPILLVTADAGASYAKPMLSNAIALGKEAHQIVAQGAAQMAAQLGATVLTHTRVTSIDSAAHRIETSGASSTGRLAYSQLVLALGAQPIRLALDGDAATGVLSVNHIDDYARLRAALARHRGPARVAILGAGLIGCEFADDLAGAGHRVTLVDPSPRPLAALAAPSLSEALAQAWLARPITLMLGTTASSVEHAGAGLRVALADGRGIDADIVLSAVGLRPALALAQAALLETRRGIVVDAYGRTSAPDIYALGDCAEYSTGDSTGAGGAVLPYVAPLLAAARAIAATLSGAPSPIALKPDAIIVKTPSCRLALAPPPPGIRGEWLSAPEGAGIVARFVDELGLLRGFGVSSPTPAQRQSLLAALGRPHPAAPN